MQLINSIRQSFTRRIIVSCIALLLSLALPCSAAPQRIKLATLAPKGSSFHQVLLAMGEKWRAAPGGGAALTVYTDGSMGGEGDMVRRMRTGQIQAAMLTAVGLAEIDDSVSALQNMPLVFRSIEESQHVREQLHADLQRRLEAKGFVVLFWGDAGWIRMFSNKPVLVPEDLRPLKVFSWVGDNKAIDLWKAAGYQPVALEVTDIHTALQTGLIDVVCTAPTHALAGQFYTRAPHMLELRWSPLVGATVITRKAWDSLSRETQAAMRTAAVEAGVQITERGRKEADESVAAMQKRGLVVHAVTPDIERAWQAAAEQAYPKIRGSIVPAEMFDRVQDILAAYRAREALDRSEDTGGAEPRRQP